MKRILLLAVLAVGMIPAESKACGLLDAIREAREVRRERVRAFFGGCGSSSARCEASAETTKTYVYFVAPDGKLIPEVQTATFLRAEKAPAIRAEAPACVNGSCSNAAPVRRFSIFGR